MFRYWTAGSGVLDEHEDPHYSDVPRHQSSNVETEKIAEPKAPTPSILSLKHHQQLGCRMRQPARSNPILQPQLPKIREPTGTGQEQPVTPRLERHEAVSRRKRDKLLARQLV